jgi:Putative zinc-finger
MGDDRRCEEVRDSLVEVSLGIASGEERAEVLAHVADCPACRRLLAELTVASDDLLQLAPEHEPSPGFELRVLEGIGATRRPRRGRSFRPLPVFAAALAAAAIAAGGVLAATHDERSLGRQLSSVLARAQGSYIAVTELRDAERRRLGMVFHYGGRPSWVFATLDRTLPAGRYRLSLVRRDGSTVDVRTVALGAGDRSLGATVDIDMREVRGLRLENERNGTVYVADF